MKKHESEQHGQWEKMDASRRHFLKVTGITTLGVPLIGIGNIKAQAVSVIVDPADSIAQSAAALWAITEFEKSLTSKGIAVKKFTKLAQAPTGSLCIVAGAANSSLTAQLLKEAKTTIPAVPEALGLVPFQSAAKRILLLLCL